MRSLQYYLIISALLFGSVACSDNPSASTSGSKYSVDWYVNHPDELQLKLKRCAWATAESLGESCLNASKAEKIVNAQRTAKGG